MRLRRGSCGMCTSDLQKSKSVKQTSVLQNVIAINKTLDDITNRNDTHRSCDKLIDSRSTLSVDKLEKYTLNLRVK